MHSEKLKKLCCMALIAVLAVSVCGCKASVDPAQVEAAQAAKEAQQAAENGTSAEEAAEADTIEELYAEAGLTPIAEDDALWTDAAFELPAIAQLLAYKATFTETFDENEPSADDFWTVTAMGVVAIPPEDATDPFKIVHAKESLVLDYSAALLPGYEAGEAAPALEDVYGISGNPRSDIIDIDELKNVIKTALPVKCTYIFKIVICGDHNELRFAAALFELCYQLVSAHLWHFHVAEYSIRFQFDDLSHRLFRIGIASYDFKTILHPGNDLRQFFQYEAVIVDQICPVHSFPQNHLFC